MRMIMIGSSGSGEARLGALLQRAGLRIEVRRLGSDPPLRFESAAAERASIPPGPEDTAFEGAESRPRALVFEALRELELAVKALRVVRTDESFEAAITIVGVDIERGDGFDPVCGFDDFVSHPWSTAEILARIAAAEHRRGELEPGSVVQIGGIRMDALAREAQVDGRSVHLTTREFALLSYLCARRGCVLSRHQLLEQVWGQAYGGGQRTVDVHIRRLRSKLGPGLRIDTVRSGGYRLRAEPRVAGRVEVDEATPDGNDASARPWSLLPLGSGSQARRWPFSRHAPG
jgi:DNA-binding response OmpR family regulator